MKKVRILPSLLLGLALTGCMAGAPRTPGAAGEATGTEEPSGPLSIEVPIGEITPEPTSGYTADIASAAARVSPAVVGLSVRLAVHDDSESVSGLGTGVMVHSDGYILTNHHVAGTAEEINVVFYDGSSVPGTTIWSDSVLDLAVVKCEGGPYATAVLGDANTLVVGQTVLAIGTPLDLSFQHTVTAGIVSAVNRALEVPTEEGVSFMEELIQTDAPINPGNSGGPLCDLNGAVVGITTLKVSGAEGLGFAIPINVCRAIVEKITREGGYETPYMGLMAIDSAIARFYGKEVGRGITVLSVDPEGPAYACGIRQGDILVSIDGQIIETMTRLREITYAAGAGGELTLTWLRDGQSMTATCRLIARPG